MCATPSSTRISSERRCGSDLRCCGRKRRKREVDIREETGGGDCRDVTNDASIDPYGGGGDGGGANDSGDGGECDAGDTKVDISNGKIESKTSGGSREAEVDLVCATIEARWLLPILRVLGDFKTTQWYLRFSADKCASAFIDVTLSTMCRTQWSCDVFHAYYVHLAPTTLLNGQDNVASVATDTVSTASVSTTAVATASVATATDMHRRMKVNVRRLVNLLRAPTKPKDHVTFRMGSRGSCSVRVSDDACIEWKQSSDVDDVSDKSEINASGMDAYMVAHGAPSRSIDSQRWWSYWRNLPPRETTQFSQSADAVRLTSETNGTVALLYRETAHSSTASVPTDVKSASLNDTAASGGRCIASIRDVVASPTTLTTTGKYICLTATSEFDSKLVRSLRHLEAYKFVTERVYVQCIGKYPLHISYDLEHTSVISAYARSLECLCLTLPTVLINIIHAYLRVPSSVDAFVSYLQTDA
jgi:hypothetical protein